LRCTKLKPNKIYNNEHPRISGGSWAGQEVSRSAADK
jgi:hypothetical protein